MSLEGGRGCMAGVGELVQIDNTEKRRKKEKIVNTIITMEKKKIGQTTPTGTFTPLVHFCTSYFTMTALLWCLSEF